MTFFARREGYLSPFGRTDVPYSVRSAFGRAVNRIESIGRPDLRALLVAAIGTDSPAREDISKKGLVDLAVAMDWFEVYDAMERVYRALLLGDEDWGRTKASEFEETVNQALESEQIGWRLVRGRAAWVGDPNFVSAMAAAVKDTSGSGLESASEHFQHAMTALSQRPDANCHAAVSHANNALECVFHAWSGKGQTLGEHLRAHRLQLHPALIKTLEGLWGFASDTARHGKEGVAPSLDEAVFCVSTAAAACSLLIAEKSKSEDRSG
ncbi:MAG: hypothetical protein WBW33_06670 [Bryobacteraceae bacterium]